MITTVLLMALSAGPAWIPVKANGFTFEMPSKPELKNGPITWPTTGQMIQTEWTSKLKTGDAQIDVVRCYESTVAAPRMIGLMYETFCKEDAPGQLRWNKVDPLTRARECLVVKSGPDGKRRTLFKILPVEANVCVLSSSALIDKMTDEASPPMRRFIDSLKATGKQTIVSLTPWVKITGEGFTFELPEKVEPKTAAGDDKKIGSFRSIKWKARVDAEEFNVLCMTGPKVTSPEAMKVIQVVCEMPGAHLFKTQLPGGATECANLGPPAVLIRFHPSGNQVCMVGATRDQGELTQSARRFVESFTRAK